MINCNFVFIFFNSQEIFFNRYQQVITLVPTDPYLLAKIGDMFESEGDKQQAFQYHSDVCILFLF